VSQPTTIQVLEKALHELGEHFEAVQILATWVEEGETQRAFRGTGNYYARLGMAHDFIQEDAAVESANQLAKKITPDNGGDV
jgi:hypothetical protein